MLPWWLSSLHSTHPRPHSSWRTCAALSMLAGISKGQPGRATMPHTAVKRPQPVPWTGGTIDAALYCEAFTGKARVLPRCRFCLSDTHASQECHYAPTDDALPQPKVPRGPMTAVGNRQPRLTSGSGVELCGLFNKAEGNQCRYRFCRYAHICGKCRAGPHPAADCGKQLASTRPSCSSSATNCPLSPRCGTGRPASTQQ